MKNRLSTVILLLVLVMVILSSFTDASVARAAQNQQGAPPTRMTSFFVSGSCGSGNQSWSYLIQAMPIDYVGEEKLTWPPMYYSIDCETGQITLFGTYGDFSVQLYKNYDSPVVAKLTGSGPGSYKACMPSDPGPCVMDSEWSHYDELLAGANEFLWAEHPKSINIDVKFRSWKKSFVYIQAY
jgi:hypothetical protein